MLEHRQGSGYRSIVVGADGSASAAEAVRQAAGLARTSGAVLHIVHAYQTATRRERADVLRDVPLGIRADGVGDNRIAAHAILEDAAADVADGAIKVHLHAVEADPAMALCWVADRKRANLIVVGNRPAARGILSRFRPRVCEQVQQLAVCPVLTVDTSHLWDAGEQRPQEPRGARVPPGGARHLRVVDPVGAD